MNESVGRRTIGAMLIAAVASFATGSQAQTTANAPADVAVQKVGGPGTPPRNRSDSALVRDVRRALRRVPQLDDSQIHIRARFGVITLTGIVPESWQISRAGNAARSVHGVRAVTNRLTSRDQHGPNIPRRRPVTW
jgi:osmotically-inducible protein OsmY